MATTAVQVKVPFLDLKAQYRSIKPEIDAAIQKVLDSTQFVLGDEVAAFEKEFAAYSGARHGVAVNSGTSALHLAMLAAGIGPAPAAADACHAGQRCAVREADKRRRDKAAKVTLYRAPGEPR